MGKELLVTRGALTTFSIANDVAKYFAILPALFAVIYPQLGVLNLMQLQSPQSAILSAIVFNALIIVVLIPLALRGVRVQAASAAHLLRRNLLIYGVGGIIVPFAGIKAIDLLLNALHRFEGDGHDHLPAPGPEPGPADDPGHRRAVSLGGDRHRPGRLP